MEWPWPLKFPLNALPVLGDSLVGEPPPMGVQLLVESLSAFSQMSFVRFSVFPLKEVAPLFTNPDFWVQQYIATADTPGTALANTADTPPEEQRDYHPSTKDFIGERLALAALNKTYGKKDIAYSGPIFDKAEQSGSSLLISFRHGKGLHTTEQIEKGDTAKRGRAAARTEAAQSHSRMPAPDETDRLIRLTESMREEDT